MKTLTFLFVVLLTSLALAQETSYVTEVLSGDSFRDSTGRTVHLLGVSAPQSGEFLAEKATNFLTLVLLDRSVRYHSTRTDENGQFYAKVAWRNWDVGASVISRGFGRLSVSEVEENTLNNYNELQIVAKNKKVGIWGGGHFMLPSETRVSGLTPVSVKSSPAPVYYSEPIYQYVSPPRSNVRAVSAPSYGGFSFYGSGADCVGGT